MWGRGEVLEVLMRKREEKRLMVYWLVRLTLLKALEHIKRPLGRPRHIWEIILKFNLKKSVGVWTGLICFWTEQVPG